MEGKTQQAAAAASATSERSVRRWQRGTLPSERRRNRRGWRTRPDPFSDVWERDMEPLLRSDPEGELSATTILEWLDERYPGRFGSSQLRTLQRRIRDYRALHGPDREVYFQQDHSPGREAQVDFTHCSGLGVTIGGETFRHLLFHLVLSHSGWSYAEVCFGETFAALVKGLQGALWELGGVPRVVRTDNLSAATHELRDSRGRAMNASYETVLAHYGVEATRTNPRSSHENGVAGQRHRRLKNALGQALILRGSRDFDSEEEYRTFVRRAVKGGEILGQVVSMSSDYVRLSGQGKCPSSPLSYDRTVIRGTCPWCASWAGSWLRRTCGPCSCGCPTPWRLPEWRGPEA